MKEQEFLTMNQVKTCPLCKRKQLPEDTQPVAGTHCYTIKYECGAEVVGAIGYEDSYTLDLKCGEVKEDLIDTLIVCRNVEERYFQDEMNHTHTKEQKIDFECLKWLCSLTNDYRWGRNSAIETPHFWDIEWEEFLETKDSIYFPNFIQKAIEGYLKEYGGTYEITYAIPDIELTIVTVFSKFDVKDVVGRELEAKYDLMKKVFKEFYL